MNVSCDYSTYKLKFHQPFVTSRKVFTERRGLILNFRSESGMTAKGDVSPLEDFGSESIEEDIDILKHMSQPIVFDVQNPLQSIGEICRNYQNYPALRTGIEQALINLTCYTLHTDLSSLINRKLKRSVSVNGLIGIVPPTEAAKQALQLVNDGYSTIKLKMGRDDFHEDLACIKAVRDTIGSNAKIRIDPNGKWSFDQAIQHLEALSKFDIEYAEQPVSGIDELIALSREVSVPLAADESVRDKATARTILEASNVAVIVLKPTLIGGLLPSIEILDLSEKRSKKIVISSAFESSIGRRYVFYVASLLQNDIAHGLSTGSLFVDDIEPMVYRLFNGRLEIEDPILSRR